MRKMVLVSIFLLLSFLFVGAVSAAPSQDIYMAVNGNDTSNTGANPNSPYATIAKGVSDVNDTCKTTMHLSEGTFTGDGNIGVVINKAHRSQGGSLTIVGAGYNKTFINSENMNRVFDIKADSNVKLVNITFINGKEVNGGTIVNAGDLSVSNCIFENSYATSSGGVIYSTSGSLNISDSKFDNNAAGLTGSSYGGAIRAISTLTSISNSSFTNNYARYSGAVYLNNATIINSYFANNYAITNYGGSIYCAGSLTNNTIINSTINGTSGQGGAVYLLGGYLYNNTMINCSATVGDYIYGYVYNANVTFADLIVTTPKATVTATVTDDMGHPFTTDQYTLFNFYANDILLGSVKGIVNGTATLTFTKLLDNGSYNLTGDFGDLSNIKNGTLTVNINRTPVYLYISPSGSDDTGDGSQNNPYLTILKAINEGFSKSIYPTIYILEGTYSGAGNTNITITDLGVLSLIGEKYNKTIIDGGNVNWIFNFGQYTQIILKNLTFENVTSPGAVTVNAAFDIDNCIFNNCGRGVYGPSYAGGIIKDSIFDNAPSTIYGISGVFIKISNCSFNNTKTTALKGSYFNVTNCKFVNGTGVAIDARGSLISTNNEFTNNIGDEFADNTAGAIYYIGGDTLYSTNDTFNGNKGVNGGAINVQACNLICVNGTFINNSASKYGGAIWGYSSSTQPYNITLENNTMINNTAVINGNDIYLGYSTIFGVNLIFVGNSTLDISKISDDLTATVTDDKGNTVSGGYVSFYLNGTYIGRADVINGLATLTYLGFKNGTYTLTGTYSNAVDPVYTKDGLVKVAIIGELDSVEYYVSKSGNDGNDGSKNSPFATIQKALTAGLELSRNITVHLLEGIYSGVGNVNITLPGTMNITIVGDGVNKSVVDGENVNWIFQVTMGDGLITLKDFKIINSCAPTTKTQTIYYSPIMIAANSTVILRNMDFSNNHGYNGGAIENHGDLTVYDSNFANNGPSNYGGGIYNVATSILEIYNSSFVNNTAKGGTAIFGGILLVKNSLFRDNFKLPNSFTGNGRAIDGAGFLNIYDSIFTNNTNSDVFCNVGNIYNSTFYNSTGLALGSGEGNVIISNCSFTGIDNAITLQPGSGVFNLSVMGCLFENGTYSLYASSLNHAALVNIQNSVILCPIQMSGTNLNLTADYNWWGNNTKPVIVGPSNLTLDYWLVMTVGSDNKPGFTKNIKASIDHYTDGIINYAFDGYLPVRDYVFSVPEGSISPVSGSLVGNVVSAVFNASGYGSYLVNVTIDNQTLSIPFELFQLNSTSTVGLSNSTGKKGDTLVITVDVKDENGDPISGGEVEFFIGNTSIGKVQVVNGTAVKEWVVDGASGECEVNARYLGSEAYLPSDNYAPFMLDTVAPVPKTDVKGGSYNTTKKVTLTATDDQDSHPKIYYTLDGTIPTIKSALYNGPVSISKTTILKFIAIDGVGNISPVQTEVYTIDTTKPNVTSIDPANGATKISASKTIKVTFSEAIKAGSKFWVDLKNSSGKAVPFNASVNGKVLTVDPTGKLAESLYILIIHTGAVTDMVGNPVTLKSSKFSVGTAPKVTKIDPKSGATKVASNKAIKVTFSEVIKKGGKLWVELKNNSGKAVSFTSSVSGKVLSIKPKSKLAESLYTLIIHTGAVTDLAGNPVALKSSKFSVGTAPKVTKIDPKSGATKVASNKAIKVTFSENIRKGSSYWIELVASNGAKLAIKKSIKGKILTITPTKQLKANTKYKLVLHSGAVTDLAGNPVSLKTISFTTKKT